MSTYKIYPVFLGENDMDSAFMTTGSAPGENLRIGIGCIAVRNNDTGDVIMLDTGNCPYEEVVAKGYSQYKFDEKDPRMKEATLAKALADLDIKPEEVKAIGITHLHWDHCWNWELFSEDTPIYVQRKELAHAITCHKPERSDYQMLSWMKDCPVWLRKVHQMVLCDGDYDLAPGIRAIFTPGHTYGSQSFVIDTKDGQYVYAGDQYYGAINMEGEGNITGWYVSINDWYESHNKIMSLNAKGVLSVHDLEIYKQKYYG